MSSDDSANAVASGKVETSADRKYPAWVRHDLERDYYDKEWGIPITHETGVLERVCLEGFQAGLSWYTVLVKRPVFREVFANFLPEKLAAFTDDDVERLLHDKRIIRNNLKIRATISNARLTLENDVSAAMSKAFKKLGGKFLGPTSCYALMCAIGMVDAHLVDSHRRGSSGLFTPEGELRRGS